MASYINKMGYGLTSINPHLFDLSCLHSAYITKMGYENNLITHWFK